MTNNKNQDLSNKIKGIGLILVIASIVYSTTAIVLGTEGYIPMILVAPQAIFALFILESKFNK